MGGEYVEFKLDLKDFNVVSLSQVSGEDLKILGLLVGKLGVEVVKSASGLWRFTGEGRLRASVEPMYWVE
jgi:hypothetical protein